MSYLVLDKLTVRFRRETVFEGLSLAAERGETIAVFGPSGAGKTVLLRLIAGVFDPDAGDVRLDGRSLLHLPPEARDVGMAFQNFALYPHLDAFRNIASPLKAQGLGAEEVRRRVQAVAELLKIDHVLSHLPKALSNGQKQRTSLARSLVREPKLLLLDDPLRNVDAKLRYEMRLELPRILKQAGVTVLYVTQDYKEAMALGDRVAVLTGGGVTQLDTPARIYSDPASSEVARLFGDPTINLLPARPAAAGAGAAVEIAGGRFPLPGLPSAALGRDCLIGIRPEHIRVAMERREGALPAELDAVTPLNVRSVLLLKTGDGGELLASCPEREAARFPRGHRAVWIDIEAAQLLVFDAESGARLGGAAP